MKQGFVCLFLTLSSACALVPDEMYTPSRGMANMASSAQSYAFMPPPESTSFAGSETVYLNNYVLNETTSAKLGETVLRVQAFEKNNYITDEMRLDRTVTMKVDGQEIVLPARKYRIHGMINLGGEEYYVLPKIKHIYFLADKFGVLQNRFLYEIKNSDNATLFPDKATISPVTARLKRVRHSNQQKIPFQDFEIIYDGIRNNRMLFFYKNAVPGTNGEAGSFDTLSFPADSTMISLKGRLLRIIRADKEQVTYIVVKENVV